MQLRISWELRRILKLSNILIIIFSGWKSARREFKILLRGKRKIMIRRTQRKIKTSPKEINLKKKNK